MKNYKQEQNNSNSPEKLTRKEALKKGGKYAALTAASMLLVLNPKESQAQSPSSPAPPTAW